MVKIKLKNKTMFFIYSVPESIFYELPLEKKTKIGFSKKYDIRKHDIVFLFYKKDKQSGFIGFIYIESDIEDNKEGIHIHKNITISEFFCVCTVLDLPKKVSIPSVFNLIKQEDKKNYDKSVNFSKNVIPHTSLVQVIDTRSGKNLFIKFIELRKNREQYIQKLDTETGMSSDNRVDSKEINEDINKEDRKYITPVCLVFCSDFKIENSNEIQQILKHIDKCRNCIVVDNNNFNAIKKLNENTVFKDIYDESSESELYDVIDSYHRDVEYAYEADTNVLYYIKDLESRYDECCFFIGKF